MTESDDDKKDESGISKKTRDALSIAEQPPRRDADIAISQDRSYRRRTHHCAPPLEPSAMGCVGPHDGRVK
jgi:hypothetical protein